MCYPLLLPQFKTFSCHINTNWWRMDGFFFISEVQLITNLIIQCISLKCSNNIQEQND